MRNRCIFTNIRINKINGPNGVGENLIIPRVPVIIVDIINKFDAISRKINTFFQIEYSFLLKNIAQTITKTIKKMGIIMVIT